jgi:hypothetical protein
MVYFRVDRKNAHITVAEKFRINDKLVPAPVAVFNLRVNHVREYRLGRHLGTIDNPVVPSICFAPLLVPPPPFRVLVTFGPRHIETTAGVRGPVHGDGMIRSRCRCA